MIGVNIKSCDRTVVEEFFQLFKTPWEIWVPGRSYDVLITDDRHDQELKVPLVIIFQQGLNSSPAGNAGEKTNRKPALASGKDGTVFPIYAGIQKVSGGDEILTDINTGAPVGARFNGAGGCTIRLGFNLFEEIDFLLRHGQPLTYAHMPTLDIHIANIRKWILAEGIPLVEIPPVPHGSPFFVCLTHDVDFAGIKNHKFDHTMAGFIYRAVVSSAINFLKGRCPFTFLVRNLLAVVSLPLIFIGLKQDIWMQFKKYLEIENGCRSTFFFVPFKDQPGNTENGPAEAIRAVKYEVADLQNDIGYLLKHSYEVGVHGIDAWFDLERAKVELNKIKELTGRNNLGVRMHWLYHNQNSANLLEEAGYAYDATWGYNESAGCRNGSFQVHKPIQANTLLELPMHIMDTALFYPDYMNLTFKEGLETIRHFMDSVSIYGGVLTLNWHHRSIAPERLWESVYRDALRLFQSRGAQFLTAGEVVNWFRKRRSIEFSEIHHEGPKIRVKLSFASEEISHADQFVLRIYKPIGKDTRKQMGEASGENFLDHPIGNLNEIEVGC